jgi:membrane protein implicated in regulation of membrane protease activity
MSPTQQDQSSPPARGSASDDPLATLHKMSTTAGLGSTDYVAVNPTAIFALIMGLASALTLFGVPLLLLLPAIGISAALIAIWQIAKSNGTQTGRALAALAILFCFAFGGFVGVRSATARLSEKRDKAALDKLISTLGQDVQQGNFDAAYQMFDDRFRTRVPATTFSDVMKLLRQNATYGKLQNATWKQLAEFQTDETTGARMAAVNVIFIYDQVGEVRQTAVFRNVDGKWMLSDIPAYFPTRKAGEQ